MSHETTVGCLSSSRLVIIWKCNPPHYRYSKLMRVEKEETYELAVEKQVKSQQNELRKGVHVALFAMLQGVLFSYSSKSPLIMFCPSDDALLQRKRYMIADEAENA